MRGVSFSHVLWIGLFLMMALISGGCAEKTPEPPPEIRIGLIVPLTGVATPVTSESAIKASELLIRRINAAGGLEVAGKRHTLRLIISDDTNHPSVAVDEARRLINEERVLFWIGSFFSHSAIHTGSVAETLGVPMITPTASSTEVNTGRSWVFRTTLSNRAQGLALGRFAYETLGLRRGSALFDRANGYNREVAEHFRDAFLASGGEMVAFESYLTGDANFDAQLKRIQAARPDIVLFPNYGHEVPVQVHRARGLGIEAVFLGSDSWDGESYEDREEFQNSYYLIDWDPMAEDDASREFKQLYREAWADEPNSTAALTWDAMGMVLKAVRETQSLDRQTIRTALAATNNYAGVTGNISFDEQGDPAKSALVLRLENGEVEIAARIQPLR